MLIDTKTAVFTMSTSIKYQTNVAKFILSMPVLIAFISITPVLKISSVDFIPYNSSQIRLALNPYPVALTVVRDANNNLVSMEGLTVEMLKWLSIFDNFTYVDTKIVAPFVDNQTNVLGSIYYTQQGYADLMVVPMIMTSERLNYVFFPHHWLEDAHVLVIPAPTVVTNISSVAQPFQLTVWILIFVSIVAMIVAFYVLTTPKVSSLFGRPVDNSLEKERLSPICFYVFGLLFSQGGSFPSDRLVCRLGALTWCLACFVLVQAYCCVLTSYLTTPTYVNLVNSAEELANKPDVRLVVRRGYIPDILLSNSKDPFYKILAAKLNSFPGSRCGLVPDCMEQILSEGQEVFLSGVGAVFEAMYHDFKKTGRCRFSIAKKTLFNRFATFGMPKNSTRKESFNRGILQMREKGLIDKWFNQFQPMPRQCLEEMQNTPSGEPMKLTLAGLSGAFLILGVGLSAATISFITEITMKKYSSFL